MCKYEQEQQMTIFSGVKTSQTKTIAVAEVFVLSASGKNS